MTSPNVAIQAGWCARAVAHPALGSTRSSRWPSRSPAVQPHRLPGVCWSRAPALGRCAAPWSPPRVPERDHGAAGRHRAAIPEQLFHDVLIILGPT